MSARYSPEDERAAVKTEQLRAFFAETNDQNLAGAFVLSLIVYVVHDGIPLWTWLPALLCLYAITLIRAWLIWQYRRKPDSRSTTQWERGQTLTGGLSGVCWGVANTAMLAHVSTEYQLFVLTVMTVSAATNASEGYSYPPPSQAFILLSISPAILWLFAADGRIHFVLAVMLLVFVPLTLWQGQKRNRAFIEALQLRFRNEALAKALAIQRDAAEQEISERKQAEENIRKSEDRLTRAELASKSGNWELHIDSMTVSGSTGAATIFGLTQNTFDLTTIQSMALSEFRPMLDAALDRAIKGDAPFNIEYKIRSADGGEIKDIRCSATLDRGRRVLFGIIEDITEKNKAEEELRVAKTTAETANLTKSRFLASASHDLRHPMQALRLFNEALARTGLSVEQQRISDNLSQSVKSMDDLLTALLDISKLDADAIKASPEVISTDALVEKINADFSAIAAAKSLRFKLQFPFRDLSVITDSKLLMSLLGNLISNAIKYTEKGGILVAIRRRSDQALIQVWDTGIGIDGAHLNTIYEEYFQVSNAERDRNKGLGLGLSIARRIAKLLGTEIQCHSRPGKGSVFEFRLPLATSGDNGPSSQNDPPKVTPTTKPTACHVVLVEDDLMVSTATTLALESCGMTVARYKTAEEALADSDIAGADFYISDLRLPGKNGIEFLDAVQRRATKQIKAVVLTGDTAASQIKMMQSTPWQVLFKPVDLDSLLAAIEARNSGQ